MVSTVPEKDTELRENTDQLLSFNKKYLQTYTHICNTDFSVRSCMIFVDFELSVKLYKVCEIRNKRRVEVILCESLCHASRRCVRVQGCAPSTAGQ